MDKQERIRDIVNVCTISIILVGIITLTSFISKSVFLSLNDSENTYVLEDLASTDLPVVKEIENKVIKPFSDNTVNIDIDYYDINKSEEEQLRSLILFDNTYMPSTGIMYASDNTFDVLSIYDGVVESIEESDTLGSIITIKHNNNFISKYSSVKDVKVNVGDNISTGEIIATSTSNKFSTSTNSLLLEVIVNGEYQNPNNIYDKTEEELE